MSKRKSVLFVLVTVLMASLCFSLLVANALEASANTEYSESFDGLSSLPSGWYLPTGNPTGSKVYVEEDCLHIDSMDSITPAAVYYDPTFGDDYIIEADFTIDELKDNGRWFGICFRVQENAGWWKGSVGFGAKYAINKFNKTNISGGGYVEYISGSFIETPSIGQTYRIRITCFGEKVSYELDGEYVTHGVLPEDSLTGNVGVCVSGVRARIDNFKVVKATEAGLEVNYKVNDIHIPETSIVNPPTVISPYNESDEIKAAISIFDLDDEGNISNEENKNLGQLGAEQALLSNVSIPAFYIHNEKQADLLVDYIKSSHLIDAFVIADANCQELIKRVKDKCYYIRGVVDYRASYASVKENLKAVLLSMNIDCANIILLPKEASKEDVFYFQRRMLTVWGYASNETDIYSLISVGVNGLVYSNASSIYNVYKSFTEKTIIREPIIMGHRGVSTLYPQNTLKGYILAYEMGAKAIEIDVNISADNQLVMFHDSTLDALTNGTGKITEKTLAELQNINVDIFASSGILEKIPTLESVFKYFADKDIVFMLDMKAGAQGLPLVKELIDKYDMADKCLIMNSTPSILALAQDLMPEVIRCRGGFNNVINKLEHDKSIEAGIMSLAPHSLQPFPYWYNTDGTWSYLYEMGARGWLTYSSTTNGQTLIDERALYIYGATSILTDDFQLARDYIYEVMGNDMTVAVNEAFDFKCAVEGFDGTYIENCSFKLISKGEYVEVDGKFKFTEAGEYIVIPCYEVSLYRKNAQDLHYEVYGKPITITVQ